MLALSLSDKFCCFHFWFQFFCFRFQLFYIFSFKFRFSFHYFFVLVLVFVNEFVIFSFFTIFVFLFVNENHTAPCISYFIILKKVTGHQMLELCPTTLEMFDTNLCGEMC